MCLALVKPAGISLNRRDVALAYADNPDGWGFTVRTPRGLRTRKGLWRLDEFWRQFAPYEHLEALVHLRWATAGTVSKANCHPFVVTPTIAVIHNGHFDGYGTGAVSDTRHWVETLLRPLLTRYPHALTDPLLLRLLSDSLGWSKLALLHPQGVTILPEGAGQWEGGIWYSQTTYRHPLPLRSLPAPPGATPTSAWDADPWDADAWDADPRFPRCDECGALLSAPTVCRECGAIPNSDA